jgi:beta-N-acetylhexosaminidase
MQIKKRFLLLWLFLSCVLVSEGQRTNPPFLQYMDHPWVDSILNKLTPEQKIAQCIWIAGWSDKDISHEVDVADKIRKYGIGGIVFFQGTPEKQAELINYYQKISAVPLLMAMDAEWGTGMRLTGVDKFPFQMTLGAISNDSLIIRFSQAVASQCRLSGININLAPVADINNNPGNPVINYRSFGERKEEVASKSLIYMKELQANGISAAIKHFPGHGDTDVDSHYDLPVLKHNAARLDSLELYPFRKLIDEGAGCVMTAHLNLPAFDSSGNIPATLSSKIIKELLRGELGFKGLVITDAMNMQGVTKYYKPGEAEARAFEAGNDVLEYVPDVESAIREINRYVSEKKLTRDEIDLKCRRILAMKYWAGLKKISPVKKENLTNLLNSDPTRALIRDLYANALTVLNNEQNIIPVRHLDTVRIATIAINKNSTTLFQERISGYKPSDNFVINPDNQKEVTLLLKKLSGYDLVIAGVYGLDQRPNKDFGITPGLITFIDKLVFGNRCIITWYGNPYGTGKIKSLENARGLLLAYQENEVTEDLSAQLIFGGIAAKGSLPVTINNKWKAGYGLITPGNIRVQYGLPENAGISSSLLNARIDSLAKKGLAAGAYPGCLVMVARKGIIVFTKTYGYQTYDNRVAIKDNDLFDLASVTKVTATLPGIMTLESEGKFSPGRTLGEYLPYFKKSNKGDIRMEEILTHQAGLTAWIPFWKETVKKNGEFRRNIFDYKSSEKYPLKVAAGLYINSRYRQKIFNEIRKSPVSPEKKYLYSDLGFIIMPEIIDRLTGEKWYQFVTDTIYHKLGAFDIGFNPWQRYPLSRIVPTEYDSLFRKQLLHGTVHDEGAAMLGGISGHAGLFTTAGDLMKVAEMYRRMGSYGGEQIIGYEVMKKYTSVQFPENNNRRGLGFDKPLLNNATLDQKDAYPAKSASPSSFGHSGYTGTFIWIDPESEISFIFLSNRVYPTRNNNKITEMNIKSDILQSVYESIIK